MIDVQKIKGLRSQVNRLQTDVDILNSEVKIKQKEINQKKSTIKSLNDEIKKLDKNTNLKVSEHAIVRYFERVLGYDIKTIEKIIINEDIKKMIETLGGSGTYPNEGFSVVMKNFTVTTITT